MENLNSSFILFASFDHFGFSSRFAVEVETLIFFFVNLKIGWCGEKEKNFLVVYNGRFRRSTSGMFDSVD